MPKEVKLCFEETTQVAEYLYEELQQWSAPYIVVLRGLPGSGKSTFAHELQYLLHRYVLPKIYNRLAR